VIVIVTDDESHVEDERSGVRARLANRVTWMPKGSGQVIIAVGSPSQWHSSLPLPPEAVTVDLVSAALSEPETARKFWGPFLSYLSASAKPSGWRQLFRLSLPGKLLVRVDLKGDLAKQAVASAIKNSPIGRKFRIL
jgi:hypothetical protein